MKKIGKGISCSVSANKLLEKYNIKDEIPSVLDNWGNCKELKSDLLILVGRIYFEDWNTFSPETREVMNKYSPEIEKLMKTNK